MDIFYKRVIKTDDYSEKIAAYHNRTEEFQQVSYLRLLVENICMHSLRSRKVINYDRKRFFTSSCLQNFCLKRKKIHARHKTVSEISEA